MRKSLVALAASLTLAPVAAASAAQAADVIGPSKISFKHAYEYVPYRITGVNWGGDLGDFCSVTLEDAVTREFVDADLMSEPSEASGRFQEYDYSFGHAGRYIERLDCVEAGKGSSNSFLVKWGSTTSGFSSTRSGSTLRVHARARHWSATDSAFVGWRNARVSLQRKSGSTWRTLRTVSSGSRGAVAVSASVPRGSTVRLLTHGTASMWGSATSGHVR